MTIAVCLITCERPDYTRRTLETFCALNDTSRFMLLHGDDASDGDDNLELAREAGFETVFRGQSRVGGQANRRAVVREAVHLGADQVLMLENDWESVRPFPWPLYEYAFARLDVWCMRLYGQFKEVGRRPAGTLDAGRGVPAEWAPLAGAPEPAEIGHIHWGAPPAVASAECVKWLLESTEKDGDAMRLSGRIDDLTVRPVRNVVYHIGEERTPEFKR